MGEATTMEQMTLPSLFDQARKIHLATSESSVDKETVHKGCEVLGKCEEMISKLGLLSSNEMKDNMSTRYDSVLDAVSRTCAGQMDRVVFP